MGGQVGVAREGDPYVCFGVGGEQGLSPGAGALHPRARGPHPRVRVGRQSIGDHRGQRRGVRECLALAARQECFAQVGARGDPFPARQPEGRSAVRQEP